MTVLKNRFQWFANPRTSALLFALLAAWILAGLGAREFLEREGALGTFVPPMFFEVLRLSGASTPLRSGFFLSWCLIAGTHFFFLMNERLRMARWHAGQREPLRLDLQQLSRAPRSREAEVQYMILPSVLRKEDALEFFREWSKPYLRGFSVLEDSEKRLQLGGVAFRFFPLLQWVGNFGFVFLVVGLLLSVFSRFEGVATLEEGMETKVVYWSSGRVPNDLRPYGAGKSGEISGLFELPFYIGLAEWNSGASAGWLNFLDEERLVGALRVDRTSPVLFQGWSIHPVQKRETHQPAITLLLKDRLGAHVLRLTHLLEREWYQIPGARVRYEFADVNREQVVIFFEENGAQYRVRLIAKKGTDWTAFREEPPSRYEVMVERRESIEQVDFNLIRDPGVLWIALGLLILFLAVIIAVFFGRTEIWMGWLPGQIWIAAQGSNSAWAKPRFQAASKGLYQALSRIDPTLEFSRPEVLSGSR